ncbi:MAG: hypothetical protein AAB839_02135 [Patescibacteria group bacterium]
MYPARWSSDFRGQKLKGDSSVPPTRDPEHGEVWNMVRNAHLATSVWNTYSLLKVAVAVSHPLWPGYRVGYGEGAYRQVFPAVRTERYIGVRHGHEDCVFALIGVLGDEVEFEVIHRGSRIEILTACLHDLRQMSEGARGVSIHQIRDFIAFV